VNLFGKPDFVFPSKHIAVFIDGCFWHGCPYCKQTPATNIEYWSAKFLRNKIRDKTVSSHLRLQGWRVIRIWEHSLNTPNLRAITRLKQLLAQDGRNGS
jgi:DNA mismatch endonuclease (patch repair protein)